MFEETLIPSRDIERVKTELNKFFDVCKEHNPDDIAAEALDLAIYVTYLWEEEGFQEGVKALEQWLTDKFPPEDDFTLKVKNTALPVLVHSSQNQCFLVFDCDGRVRHRTLLAASSSGLRSGGGGGGKVVGVLRFQKLKNFVQTQHRCGPWSRSWAARRTLNRKRKRTRNCSPYVSESKDGLLLFDLTQQRTLGFIPGYSEGSC